MATNIPPSSGLPVSNAEQTVIVALVLASEVADGGRVSKRMGDKIHVLKKGLHIWERLSTVYAKKVIGGIYLVDSRANISEILKTTRVHWHMTGHELQNYLNKGNDNLEMETVVKKSVSKDRASEPALIEEPEYIDPGVHTIPPGRLISEDWNKVSELQDTYTCKEADVKTMSKVRGTPYYAPNNHWTGGAELWDKYFVGSFWADKTGNVYLITNKYFIRAETNSLSTKLVELIARYDTLVVYGPKTWQRMVFDDSGRLTNRPGETTRNYRQGESRIALLWKVRWLPYLKTK